MNVSNERVRDIEGGLKRVRDIECPELRRGVESMLRDGFVIIRRNEKFLGYVERARDAYYKFREMNASLCEPYLDQFNMLSRVVNLHGAVSDMLPLFSEAEAALNLMDYFLGETVAYTSLYFERGSNQDIHRDTPYFFTQPAMMYMGYWVALDDVDATNGPLEVIAGGHRLPEFDKDDILRSVGIADGAEFDPLSMDLWVEYQRRIVEGCNAAGLVKRQVHLNKGDAVIWHAQTPHGGAKTLLDNKTRNSMVFHVTPKNTPVGHQDAFYGKKALLQVGSVQDAYTENRGRLFKAHAGINFSHKKSYDLADMKCL
jgi:phytanoyl-CoA hydroxylase